MSEYGLRYPNGKKVAGRMNLLLSLAGRDLGESMLDRVVQGSYNKGGVSASAGTHDAGGAVDLSTRGWSYDRITQVLTTLRRRGLIAWHRHEGQGFSPHIHGIDRGARDLSAGAAEQVRRFDLGENGLALRQRDDGPRVTVPSFDYANGLDEWNRTLFDTEDKDEDMGSEYIGSRKREQFTIPRGKEVTIATLPKRPGQAVLYNLQLVLDTGKGLNRARRAKVRFVRVPAVDGTGEQDYQLTSGRFRLVHNHAFIANSAVEARILVPGKGNVKIRYAIFKGVRFG